MAEIRPFCGIRYNQSKIRNIGSVICPPHDVIPLELQEELYRRSEHNFVRIEFGRELPHSPQDNRYTRAAATMNDWLSLGVFKQDEIPAIYIHDYYFVYRNLHYKRRGIISRVRLEEWDKRIIFPHEGTLSQSKADRLSVLWSCEANTSPILALFQDTEKSIIPELELQESKKPIIETEEVNGERHVIWAINSYQGVKKLCEAMSVQSLYIADGHHRYESALTYKHEHEVYGPITGEEGFNFVMMTLVEFNDPGLLILPPHRLVGGISKSELACIRENLDALFNIETFSVNDTGVWQRIDTILRGGLNNVHLGLYGLENNALFILELKEPALAGKLMPAFHSEIYKNLDVSIVDHVILENLLSLGNHGEKAVLDYTYDKQEAVQRVRSGEFQLAILLNPVKADVIKAISDAGDRMPRKSTYFYPKEPAGLVFNMLK